MNALRFYSTCRRYTPASVAPPTGGTSPRKAGQSFNDAFARDASADEVSAFPVVRFNSWSMLAEHGVPYVHDRRRCCEAMSPAVQWSWCDLHRANRKCRSECHL